MENLEEDLNFFSYFQAHLVEVPVLMKVGVQKYLMEVHYCPLVNYEGLLNRIIINNIILIYN